MNLYLSSFRIGDRPDELRRLAGSGSIGLIPNAMDHAAPDVRTDRTEAAFRELEDVGVTVELLDLTDYFGAGSDLRVALGRLAGVWVRGGNTFVLMQAMRLSGFDHLLPEVDEDFLYAGYSAGVCVLAPGLRGIQHVDDPTARPYGDVDASWDGLGILDYLVLPHYDSDHPESTMIDDEVDYCVREGIPFRTLRDGEVIILEGHEPRRR